MPDRSGWGILATGRIARCFAARPRAWCPDAELAAVGSRTAASAEAFAAELRRPPARTAPTTALVADPDVDVVYVASPHALHLEHARLALEAGKHVLCEKPLTLTVAEAEEMVALARERGLFLMEAMWMACHPVIRAVCDGLAAGRLRHARARCTPTSASSSTGRRTDRLLDPALGGGALLDMGIYPLTLAHLLLGEPTEPSRRRRAGRRGVDLDVAIAGRYAGGAVAALTASMTARSPRTATIATDRGRFDLPVVPPPDRTPSGPRQTGDPRAPIDRRASRCSAPGSATRPPR